MSSPRQLPGVLQDSKSRRSFLQATSATLAGLALMPRGLFAGTNSGNDAETVIGELYNSLTETQRKAICLAVNDPIRVRVNANWHVTKPLIGSDFYDPKQKAMIDEIVRKITSEEGHKKLMQQLDEDDGGIGAYSLAIFGNPSRGESGKDPFECLITGRHLTLRALVGLSCTVTAKNRALKIISSIIRPYRSIKCSPRWMQSRQKRHC